MGKVKLFIFESPDDAARFEHPTQTVTIAPVSAEELNIPRHYKKKDPAIEAQKKRILEKAAGRGRSPSSHSMANKTCKQCGGKGHRSDSPICPKNKPQERFDSNADDEE